MRRAAKVDRNHAEIVQALRAVGCTVQSLAAVADGCPDLLVGCAGRTALLEIKDPQQPPNKRKLKPLQLEWHANWRGGTLAVVCDVESAIRVARTMESTGNT